MKQLARILATFVLAATVSHSAGAQTLDKTNSRAKALIARLNAEPANPPKLLAAPILNFSLSPAVALQGRQLSAYIQSDNSFSGRDLSIDVKVNGTVRSNVYHPSRGLFVAPLGIQTEQKTNSIEATLFLENTQNNTDIRNAIKALDVDIKRLTNQINAERDSTKRKILESQRAEKIALKTELLTQLKKFRYKVGTQAFSYNVQPDTSSPTLPKITSVAPLSGNVAGGTRLTISGANFNSNVDVKIGGVTATNISYVNSNVIQATTPNFGRSDGAKDVELRFTTNDGVFNAIAQGAFFATSAQDLPPRKPVAVANGSQRIQLGETAQLDGGSSYDPNGDSLKYKWTFVSVPIESNYVVGEELPAVYNPSITPTAVGSYVLQLTVKEEFTEEKLESDPSTVVVQVGTVPQPTAAPIIVIKQGTATSQVFPNYFNPGDAIAYSITEQPTHGTASVSPSGLVTYVAGNYIGQDSLTVEVSTQSGLTGSVVIPITVRHANYPPIPTAGSISTHSEPGQAQVFPNDPDAGQTHTYEVSFQPRHGSATVDANGMITYNSDPGYVGSDLLAVKVTDSGLDNLSGQVNVSVTVNANSAPQVTVDPIFIVAGATGTSQASVSDDAFQTGSYSVTQPSNGTSSISSGGVVTYTPNNGFAGEDTFNVSWTDNGSPNLIGTASVAVTVNGAPVVSAPNITVTTGGQATSQVNATDPNAGQTLTYSITTAPAHGSATISTGGLVTYSSTGGYTGADSLVVTVTDNGTPNLATNKTIDITVEANHAPTASAPSIAVAANGTATSQVTASAEDAGETLTYSISAQPANGSASVNSSGLVTFVSNSQYSSTGSIGVTVTDNGYPNLSTSISIPVTVEGINNQPPVIPDPLFYRIQSQGVPYQVALSVSGNAVPAGGITDPDGTVVSAEWDFGDGTHEKTTDLSQAGLQHNYMATGTYTATLTVKDDFGATSTRQLTVNVVDTDIPTAKFTVSPSNGGGGSVPITITFNASASSDADGITQYRWLWGSGTEQVTTSSSITHTFTAAGTYNVRLRTRDANQAEGVAVVPVVVGQTVTGAPSQAIFQIGPPREVILGNAASFSGARSFNPNIGGTLAAYNWNFNDFATCPGSSGGCTATGVSTSFTYPGARNYFPSLQVQTGSGGQSNRVPQEVFVVNSGHAPRAITRASSVSGVAPLTVHFDGGDSYDYDGSLTGHSWAVFSNGNCSPNCNISGQTLDHTFATPGAYQVNLTVSDNDGNSTLVSTTVNVTSTALKPARAKRTEYDPDREAQRQLLSNACGSGDGEACSQLADMYAEDGNSSAAAQLKEYACQLGYAPACAKSK